MLVAGKGRVQLLVSQPCSSGRLHIQDHMDNTNSYGRVKKKDKTWHKVGWLGKGRWIWEELGEGGKHDQNARYEFLKEQVTKYFKTTTTDTNT